MHVLVAGGAGFLGSHLCDRLINRKDMVTCVDNLSTGRVCNIEHLVPEGGFQFIESDICADIDISGPVNVAPPRGRLAGNAALAFAFGDLGAGEVVAFTEVHNSASRALMERLGMAFRREIRLPRLVAGRTGVYEDAPFGLCAELCRRCHDC